MVDEGEGLLGWQEGRYMRFHHWRPVRKTPILIRSHLSFFERCEKNNVGFPTTILIKASLENDVEMLRVKYILDDISAICFPFESLMSDPLSCFCGVDDEF